MGRCGRRGRAHHKHTLNSKHPFIFQSFRGSRGYSIYSFAQLSWHCTAENELWMVDSGFNLFSSPFPSLLLKHLPDRTSDGKIFFFFFFPSHFTFKNSLQKPARINFGWVDVEEGAGPTTSTRVILSTLLNFSLFMALEDILSIVLRSCPGTAMGRMNFGWKDLGFPLFSSPFPFHSFLLKNLQE